MGFELWSKLYCFIFMSRSSSPLVERLNHIQKTANKLYLNVLFSWSSLAGYKAIGVLLKVCTRQTRALQFFNLLTLVQKLSNADVTLFILYICGSGGCLGSAAEWVERGCGSGNGV